MEEREGERMEIPDGVEKWRGRRETAGGAAARGNLAAAEADRGEEREVRVLR